MGIDRQRIVDNFYPPGSSVAERFTPCAIPFGCAGTEDWYTFDPEAAQGAPRRGRLRRRLRDQAPVPRGGPWLPARPADHRAGDRQPAGDQPGHQGHLEEQESGTFLDNNAAGAARRHLPARLGCGLPGHQQLPRLPLRRRHRQEVRRRLPGARRRPQSQAARARTTPTARPSYGEANDLIKQLVPAVTDRPRRLRDRVQGRCRPGRTPRRSATRCFSVMQAGDRDTLVVDAERRAAQHLLRATRRTARRSVRASRSRSPCTPTPWAAPRPSPRSRPAAPPTRT